eukprot:m.152312 g.152312  ORF g.152312 m.152312 type:complete len:182 (+) comp10160_c1_seq3:3294-3839(+)
MFHCHNLMHEDNDMMRAFELSGGNVLAGQVPDTPQGANQGAVDPHFDPPQPVDQLPPINLAAELARGWYNVFYPENQPQNSVLQASNIWEVQYNRQCVREGIIAPRLVSGRQAQGQETDHGTHATSGDSASSISLFAVVAVVVLMSLVIGLVVVSINRLAKQSVNNANVDIDDGPTFTMSI